MELYHNYLNIYKPTIGDFGIELECELNFPLEKIPGFENKDDGSLRGLYPTEVVSRGAIKKEDLDKRVRVLCAAVDRSNPDRLTRRTSLHVHINCLHLTPIQIVNAIVYSWCIEPAMLNMCAPHRRRNKFATPFQYCDYLKTELDSTLSAKTGMIFTSVDRTKYSATAIHTLGSIGTIEFRAHEFTTDPEKFIQWCQLCYDSVHVPASLFKNPLEIVETVLEGGINKYLNPVLHDKMDVDATLMNAMSLYPIVSKYDWNKWTDAVNKYIQTIKKSKKIEQLYDANPNIFAVPAPAAILVGNNNDGF